MHFSWASLAVFSQSFDLFKVALAGAAAGASAFFSAAKATGLTLASIDNEGNEPCLDVFGAPRHFWC